VTRVGSTNTVDPRRTGDHTIVVRVWVEPHDDEPRARLVDLGRNREVTARGFDDIERAFDSMVRQLLVNGGALR
jgi:hypothetical protein